MQMTTPASEFSAFLAFDERSAVYDGYGNKEGIFVEKFQRRAVLKPLRGGEQVQAARLASRQPYLEIGRAHV